MIAYQNFIQIRSTVRHELAQTIGRTIARWRTAHDMTQEELAIALDIDPMTVSRFERGVTLPSLVTIRQLANVFGVSMAQMLEDVPSQESGEIQVVAALLNSFSSGEREFLIETLKRYRALQQRQRRKNINQETAQQTT